MAVDYDLVVIGATGGGLATARQAIAAGQKVALVQHHQAPLQDVQLLALEKLLLHLAEQPQPHNISNFLQTAIAPWDFYEPLAKLSESGVDVIAESGQFVWQPRTHFVTETRRLQAKHWAIATGTTWDNPPQKHFLTLPDLLKPETWQNLADEMMIVGQSPQLLQLAYCLKKLGKKVNLIAKNRLLPQEDFSLVQHLQTVLEAAGIHLYFDLKPDEKTQLLQQENTTVIWGDRRRGLTTNLNLPPDFCHPANLFLQVNSQLQTPRKNIYGCGSVLGGYDLPELAIAEATTITQNRQRKRQNCPYQWTPYRLFQSLPFDQIGYPLASLSPDTKTETKTLMMDRIDQLQFPHDLTLKLWLNPQNKLLRATVIGDRSGKIIYHCRHLMQTQTAFTNWQNLLENAGIFAEICW